HERRSIIITTNLGYKQWTTVFHDATCLAALVDRFAQHCHTVDIDADSWRNKEAQERQDRANTTTTKPPRDASSLSPPSRPRTPPRGLSPVSPPPRPPPARFPWPRGGRLRSMMGGVWEAVLRVCLPRGLRVGRAQPGNGPGLADANAEPRRPERVCGTAPPNPL